MVLEGHSQGAMGMQLLAGVQVLWICFLECTACSLSVCCPRVKSKGFLRIQGVMELQGDILQGRQMFSGSFSPMDYSPDVVLVTNWGHTCSTSTKLAKLRGAGHPH